MNHIRQAVILAGGRGMRLRPLTDTVPKPMIRICGRPFLWYLIHRLRRNNIVNIVILVGYLHDVIERYFGDGKRFGVSITYSYQPPEADTGTRIRHALPLLDAHFMLLYGDNLWPLEIGALERFYVASGVQATVVVYNNRDKATKNNVCVDTDSRICVYDRKRMSAGLNGVDIGFFIFDKKVFKSSPSGDFSFEDVIIPRLVQDRQIMGYRTDLKYYGLSTPERIPNIQKYVRRKKCIFMDRDGVINVRPPKASYVRTWEEFVFLPKVLRALNRLHTQGYSVFIVSNQPGIARRMITPEALDAIHKKMLHEVRKSGGDIAGIYVCPHGWHDGCVCRKPNPGLFFDAAGEHAVDLTDSICIGDDVRDIMAGKRAACKKTILIGDPPTSSFSPDEQPDTICKTLYDAAVLL